MKRVLLVLLIPILLFLVVPASANIALNFQNPSDFITSINWTGVSWVQSINGGNSNIMTPLCSGGDYSNPLINEDPLLMSYSAVTVTKYYFAVQLLDTNKALLWRSAGSLGSDTARRLEMKMIGSSAYIYADGVEITHSGVLAQNPSYVGKQ